MAGYTRQDTANNIANGNVIDANDLDAEFNQVESAFSSSTGHKHDGTSGEGPRIEKFGQAGELDGSTANVLKPKTDGTVDLGASDTEFKDAYFDGTVKTDVLTVDETSTLTGNVTASADVSVGGTLTVTGATSLNGNVDLGDTSGDTVTVTGQVDSSIIPSADDTYDLGSTTKEWRNLYLDGTAEIDTLNATTVDINGGAIDGTVIGANASAAITGTTITGTSFVGDGSALTGLAQGGLFAPGITRNLTYTNNGTPNVSDDVDAPSSNTVGYSATKDRYILGLVTYTRKDGQSHSSCWMSIDGGWVIGRAATSAGFNHGLWPTETILTGDTSYTGTYPNNECLIHESTKDGTDSFIYKIKEVSVPGDKSRFISFTAYVEAGGYLKVYFGDDHIASENERIRYITMDLN